MIQTLQRPTFENMTSVIFPQTPAKLNIHKTPKSAQFLAYRVTDVLTLTAWMPNGFASVNQEGRSDNDRFYQTNCMECERNCAEFLDDYRDEYGDIQWEDVPHGHCDVYNEGYYGQDCPMGYVPEPHVINFPIANMVFEIDLSYIGNSPRFSRRGDSAYLCKGVVDSETNEIYSTELRMAANVFGSSDNVEGICWGGNNRPNNLQSIVASYISSPFNNDLLNIPSFEQNCRQTVLDDDFVPAEEKYICEGVDAVALLDVEKDLQAFFTFLVAGFNSLPEAPHIMIVPMNNDTIEMGGQTYMGYKTLPDAVGRQWFITYDGDLLGQV